MSQVATLPTQLQPQAMNGQGAISVYADAQSFEVAQRMARSLSMSTMVPEQYRGNEGMANCLVAMELAYRIGCSVFMIMQNVDVIHGRPSFRAQFLIAALNSCGRFEPLRFHMEGKGSSRSCYAWTKSKTDSERLEGPLIDMAMANAEGWSTKKGSKWKTMPELMLRYRAAAFFSRLYAPEITMGMQTAEELSDIGRADRVQYSGSGTSINAALNIGGETIDAESEPADDEPTVADVAGDLLGDQTAEPLSYAEVAEAINKAEDLDSLGDAFEMISRIPDKNHRIELLEIAEKAQESMQEQNR